MTPSDLDELAKLEAAAWKIIHEEIPAWWNEYTRRFPQSKHTEMTLREMAAHHCVLVALQSNRNAAKALIERVRVAELLLERTNTYAWPATALMEVDMLCQQRDKHATDLTVARANAKSDAETIARLRAERQRAIEYAENLATILVCKHHHEATTWIPLRGDLVGLLTQIDNAVADFINPEERDSAHARGKAEGREEYEQDVRKWGCESFNNIDPASTAVRYAKNAAKVRALP